jgi:hypothetical protein
MYDPSLGDVENTRLFSVKLTDATSLEYKRNLVFIKFELALMIRNDFGDVVFPRSLNPDGKLVA